MDLSFLFVFTCRPCFAVALDRARSWIRSRYHIVAHVYIGHIFSYEIQVSIPPQTSHYKTLQNSRRPRLCFYVAQSRRTSSIVLVSTWLFPRRSSFPLRHLSRRRHLLWCRVFASSHLQCCRARSYSLPPTHILTRGRAVKCDCFPYRICLFRLGLGPF